MQRVIGGEFDIDISRMASAMEFAGGTLYSSGRAALFNILKHIDAKGTQSVIMLPDYLCESVLDAVNKFKFRTVFYALNADLTVDKEDFSAKYTESSIVLLINYFGCIDCATQVSYVKGLDSGAVVIQDNVQAFYAMNEGTGADYYFTSFRKTFAVPDGAWAVSVSGKLPEAVERNTFSEYKIAGGILKHLAQHHPVEDKQYLDLFHEGENRINDNFLASITSLTLNLLSEPNINEAANVRRKNASYIINGLRELGIEPIVRAADGQVPLFVPIRLKNRNEVRSSMFAENIFCPIHWPVPQGHYLMRGEELAGSELSLIIDQRYGEEDMNRILKVLKKHAN
jgi:hypothetical protein